MKQNILNKLDNNRFKMLIVLGLMLLSWLIPWLCTRTIWFNRLSEGYEGSGFHAFGREFQVILTLLFLLLNFYLLLRYQGTNIFNKKIYRRIAFINFIFGIIVYFGVIFVFNGISGGSGESAAYWYFIVGPAMIIILVLYSLFLSLNVKYMTNLYLVSIVSVIVTAVYSLPLLLLQGGIASEDIWLLVLSGPIIGTVSALITRVIKNFNRTKVY